MQAPRHLLLLDSNWFWTAAFVLYFLATSKSRPGERFRFTIRDLLITKAWDFEIYCNFLSMFLYFGHYL